MILALTMNLPSVANLREHWATRARRAKAQRRAIALAVLSERRKLLELQAELARGKRLVVTLMRVAPRRLDDDNLAGAFKACRDEVAKQLGVNDGSDSVAWKYDQRKPLCPGSTPGVLIMALPEAS